MSRQRRSLVHLGGAWALTLLLFVPVVYAGHHHGVEQPAATHSCATCTATHTAFTPAVAPVVVATSAVAHPPFRHACADVTVQLDQDDHHGRAPPTASSRRPL